jgi:uncharacterized protein (TIGR02594 family)
VIFTLLVNSSIQRNKIKLENIKQDNEHISKFVSYAIDKDIEIRKDMAEYFVQISSTEEAKNRWNKYLISVNELINTNYEILNNIDITKKNKDKLQRQLSRTKVALLNNPSDDNLKAKALELERLISKNQQKIQEKENELSKLNSTNLNSEVPNWYKVAQLELKKDVKETPGIEHNVEILKYHKSLDGISFDEDEIPWSSSFVNWCLSEVDITGTNSGMNRSWLNWGKRLDIPKVGCVVVLWRESKQSWKGNVGFYVGENDNEILILGGNLNNSVSIVPISKEYILDYRWPK